MPETCLSLWLSEQSQWSVVAEVWRRSDLLQQAIYISLVLMLVYTLFVVIRFLRLQRTGDREFRAFGPESIGDFYRNRRTLTIYLTRGLEMLRGIAYGAPILALAGTSYGILAAASSYGYGHRTIGGSFINFVSQDFAATLINTASGILVAASATLSHNLLRTGAEASSEKLLPRRNSHECDSRTFQYAQSLPLKQRLSGPPHFALVAAPILAFLAMAYVVFRPYPIPKGLHVGLMATRPADRGDYPKPMVVTIFGRRDELPLILVNSKEVSWDNFQEVAKENMGRVAEPRAYVEADEDVRLAYIAEAVDTLGSLHCRVVLLSSLARRRASLPSHSLRFRLRTLPPCASLILLSRFFHLVFPLHP